MEELKNVKFKIVNEKKLSINDFIECFKENIYSVLFYTSGLILGAYFYSVSANEAVNEMLTLCTKSIYIEIIANLILYLTIWLIITLMGFSMIGFSIMNAIPLFAGIYFGLKSACYFTVYNVKGIGYTALAIAPVSALMLVLIIYTISYHSRLSKSIYTVIKEKGNGFTLTVKPLITHIIIQLVLYILLSVISSLLHMGMINIISI